MISGEIMTFLANNARLAPPLSHVAHAPSPHVATAAYRPGADLTRAANVDAFIASRPHLSAIAPAVSQPVSQNASVPEFASVKEAIVDGSHKWLVLPSVHDYDVHYVINRHNGDIYNDDLRYGVRLKHVALVFGNPILNLFNVIANIFTKPYLAAKAAIAHEYKQAAWYLLDIVLSPFVWIGMQLSAMLGTMAPFRGRQLFQACESHLLWRLAPCFEPIGNVKTTRTSELESRARMWHALGGVVIAGTKW